MANFYLVSWDGTPNSIIYVDDEERFWSYVENTRRFHLNPAMHEDFYFSQENTYTPISAEDAAAQIHAGLGHIDERSLKFLVDRYRADTKALTVDEVLPAERVLVKPTPQQRARALSRALEAAPFGQPITWAKYPKQSRQRAYVAAQDLQKGKIRAIAALQPVRAYVTPAGDDYIVSVERVAAPATVQHA